MVDTVLLIIFADGRVHNAPAACNGCLLAWLISNLIKDTWREDRDV